jgi:hypothetical protein
MLRQKLRIMVIGAQKKYTPFEVYFDIPQMGYKNI